MTAIAHNTQPTFEETWPKAPFAELIRLALSLADTLVKLRARPKDSASAGMGRGQYA
jgi:hypothetical protein